ncbi:hypothetical protein PMIN04_003207 [Paraphaeosphaeria minitans]
MRTSIFALAPLASAASAARFILHIPNTPLVNPSSLLSTTHATLQSSGAPLDSYITRSNSFNFNNVSVGSYLATIHSRDYAFEPLRIDVTLEEVVEGSGDQREKVAAWQTFIGNEWDNKGESRGEGGNGLVIEAQPRIPKVYYQERAGCKCILANEQVLKSCANDPSLPPLVLEEPYDPHGSVYADHGLWHAIPDGQHGPRNQGRVRRDAEEGCHGFR